MLLYSVTHERIRTAKMDWIVSYMSCRSLSYTAYRTIQCYVGERERVSEGNGAVDVVSIRFCGPVNWTFVKSRTATAADPSTFYAPLLLLLLLVFMPVHQLHSISNQQFICKICEPFVNCFNSHVWQNETSISFLKHFNYVLNNSDRAIWVVGQCINTPCFKKTSTHIIGYKLRNSYPILIIFDTKIPHIIWHCMTA